LAGKQPTQEIDADIISRIRYPKISCHQEILSDSGGVAAVSCAMPAGPPALHQIHAWQSDKSISGT